MGSRKKPPPATGKGSAPHRPDGPSTSQTPSPPPADASPSPGAEEEKRVEQDFGELIAGLERERDEYLELARRTKADFENYRKRVAGEAAVAEKRGRAEIARDLFPAIDNLDRALAASQSPDQGPPPNHLAEGVRLVRDELADVLKRNGVESFEPAGEPFDPHQHEAMMVRPAGADGAGKVLEVLEKGYRSDGQVLRPARVVVGEAEQQPPADGKPAGGFAEGM